nr:MAG TPA: hypothetical protein [Caudoviricetes sp.]
MPTSSTTVSCPKNKTRRSFFTAVAVPKLLRLFQMLKTRFTIKKDSITFGYYPKK